jgi:membrane fusion protein, multidrug efflux system
MRHSIVPKHLIWVGGFALAAALSGCGKGNSYKPPPPPPVITSKPVSMPMTSYMEITGSTVAINSVNLVARVSGYLQSIDFSDGSVVQKGQRLFVIEPAPYAAKLQQAQASVASAQAQVLYAQSQYDRQLGMLSQNATSKANVEQWLSTRDSDKAQVVESIANEELAAINFGYTSVAAPFTGQISRHFVDIGNLVGNGTATTLATIDQLDPIYVYFNVNEQDLLSVRKAMVEHGLNPGDVKGRPIYIGLQSEEGYPHLGKLDYIAPGVDPSTGTIEVRALFDNPTNVLLPGLFVRGEIPLGAPVARLALPDAAVMSDQAGSYVYVVGTDNVVVQKRVTTGVDNNSMVAVTGLDATDQVVVDGLQNAAPGTTVAPTEKDMTAPAPDQPGQVP